jgi:hypothetical protein
MNGRVVIRLLALSVVLACLATFPKAIGQDGKPQAPRPIPVIVAWAGEVEVESARKAKVPPAVLTEAEWKKLWTACKNTESAPYVNFDEAIVLVAFGDGVNGLAFKPGLDLKGDLRPNITTTLLASDPDAPRIRYQFALISKNGIKSISGVPILKK